MYYLSSQNKRKVKQMSFASIYTDKQSLSTSWCSYKSIIAVKEAMKLSKPIWQLFLVKSKKKLSFPIELYWTEPQPSSGKWVQLEVNRLGPKPFFFGQVWDLSLEDLFRLWPTTTDLSLRLISLKQITSIDWNKRWKKRKTLVMGQKNIT